MESKKIDANNIEITETVITKKNYYYNDLKAMRERLVSQRDENMKSFNDEIARIDLKLAECVKVGVVEKVQ